MYIDKFYFHNSLERDIFSEVCKSKIPQFFVLEYQRSPEEETPWSFEVVVQFREEDYTKVRKLEEKVSELSNMDF